MTSRTIAGGARQAFAQSGEEGQRTGTERTVGFHCDWLKNIRVGEARIFRLFATGSEVCCGAGRLSRRRQIRSCQYMLSTVTSQVKGLPPCHGINVRLSGLLPSCLVKPTGSFVTGVPADCIIIIIIIYQSLFTNTLVEHGYTKTHKLKNKH